MKHPKPNDRFVCVSVRMPTKLYDAVVKLADADRRKISDWMRLAVERAVEVWAASAK
jgi:hypothetical protein